MTKKDYELLAEALLDTERATVPQRRLACIYPLLNALEHRFPNFNRTKFETYLNVHRARRGQAI